MNVCQIKLSKFLSSIICQVFNKYNLAPEKIKYWILWILLGIFFVGLFRFIFKRGIEELLYELSEDIKEIKERLSMLGYYRRKERIEEADKKFIKGHIRGGGSVKELRKIFGFLKFHRYKKWISYYIQQKEKEEERRKSGKWPDRREEERRRTSI